MREMKDSGVEWIGEIPIDWEAGSFGNIIMQNDGGVWGLDPNGYNDSIVLRSTEQTIDGYWSIEEPAKRDLSDIKTLEYYRCRKDDLLITKSSGSDLHIGKTTIVDEQVESLNCYYSNFIQRVRVQYIYSAKYYWYVLNSDIARSQFSFLSFSTSGLGNINSKTIKKMYVPFPSSLDQHRIADYLDAKCAQIDRAIARQQEVIEKLKEYKLSVITEAVTKGLNPDVPMKDSGIEWIGEIPEHWEVSALKNYIDVLPGYAFSSLDFDTENGIPLLRGVNVTPNGLRWDDVVYWNKSISDELEPFALCKNDIVFGLDRPWINEGTRITIISENDLPCLLLQRVCRIRGTGDLDFRIVFYWLGSSMFQDIVSLATTGVSVPHISTRQIGNFFIAVPPEAEQKHICEYLDSRCSSINAIVIRKNEIISKLTEYKKSLIYEVVTGKRDV